MNEKPSKWKVFTAGIIRENPVLRLVLGCCSALAVTTTVSGAVGMGLAMTFVLVCSNIVISALRKVIPAKVHLPCYIVIIATFVTVVQMVLQAFVPDLYKALGVYLALIVVNCIIHASGVFSKLVMLGESPGETAGIYDLKEHFYAERNDRDPLSLDLSGLRSSLQNKGM